MSPTAEGKQGLGDSRGFTLLQMMFTVAVLGVLAAMSVIGIRSARSSLRLQNSARSFAQMMEKARLDAIRRRVTTHAEFTGPSTYEISMDFLGNGTTQTRSFTLETNVSITDANGQPLASDSYPYADFDWRGRTAQCSMLFNMMNDRGETIIVQVAGSGDITVNRTAVTSLPTIAYSNVNSTSDIAPTTVFNGNNTPLNLAPCGSGGVGITSGGGSVPPPVITCSAGTMTLSTGYVTVSRNGGSTQSVSVTLTTAGTVSATPDPNLSVTPATRTVSSGGGTVTFTVASVTKSRGTYPVKFNFSTCSPATLYVKVVN